MRERCFQEKSVKPMLLLSYLTILKLLFALSLAAFTMEKAPNTKLGNLVTVVSETGIQTKRKVAIISVTTKSESVPLLKHVT